MDEESLFDASGAITRKDFMRLSAAGAAALAVESLSGCASFIPKNVPKIDYTGDVLLKNCNAIDVAEGRVMPNASILVRNGLIHSLDGSDIGPAATVFDMAGKYAIPGLIDAHNHSTVTSCFGIDTADLSSHLRQQKRNYSDSIEAGITTFRDMGAFPGMLHGMIKDIAAGRLNGPRVQFCNSILNLSGSHPEVSPSDAHPLAPLVALFTGMVMTNFKDMKELRSVIAKNSEGAHFIKLTMDNRSLFAKKPDEIPVYTDEMLACIFDFAQRKSLPVACHVNRKFGFDRAVRYPVSSLEHVVSDALLTDSEAELLVKKNISVVPTMIIGLNYMMEEAYDRVPERFRSDLIMGELGIRREYMRREATRYVEPVIHRKNLDAIANYRTLGYDNLWKHKLFLINPDVFFNMVMNGTKNIQKMRAAGVNLGLGIDAGMPFSYFGSQHRELEFLARAGFRNDEILRIATSNGAKILGMQDKIGTLEKGRCADIVLLDKNPLSDVTAYRDPRVVMKAGAIVFSRSIIQPEKPASAS